MRESRSYGSVRERGGNEPFYSDLRTNLKNTSLDVINSGITT